MLGGRMNSRQSQGLRLIHGVLKGLLLGLPIGGLILVLNPLSSQMNVPLAHFVITGFSMAGGLWETCKPHWLLQTWKQSLTRIGLRPHGRVGSHRAFSGTIDGRRVIWSLPTNFVRVERSTNSPRHGLSGLMRALHRTSRRPCTHRYWYVRAFQKGLSLTSPQHRQHADISMDTVQRYSFRISGRVCSSTSENTSEFEGATSERDQIIDMVQRPTVSSPTFQSDWQIIL